MIHGGGSFGHTLVRECLSAYGYITQECFVRVAHYMMLLNNIVMEVLLANNIKAVSLPTRSACYISDSEVICNVEQVRRYLEDGVCPVVFGDVVIDARNRRYVVVSGDRIAHIIARELRAKEIVFVTDVEGIFTSDPKKNRSARLIKELKVSEVYSKVEFKEVADVTGGMEAKVSELIRQCAEGSKIIVVGGLIKDNLYNALSAKEFIGTTIWC